MERYITKIFDDSKQQIYEKESTEKTLNHRQVAKQVMRLYLKENENRSGYFKIDVYDRDPLGDIYYHKYLCLVDQLSSQEDPIFYISFTQLINN